MMRSACILWTRWWKIMPCSQVSLWHCPVQACISLVLLFLKCLSGSLSCNVFLCNDAVTLPCVWKGVSAHVFINVPTALNWTNDDILISMPSGYPNKTSIFPQYNNPLSVHVSLLSTVVTSVDMGKYSAQTIFTDKVYKLCSCFTVILLFLLSRLILFACSVS